MGNASFNGLPGWPRHLTRQLAALYVGVCADVFTDEVRKGMWPKPRARGEKGGRLTWDRLELDRASEKDHAPAADDTALTETLKEALNGETTRGRIQDRKAPAGRRHNRGISIRQGAA